jgi:hypothetical protein
MIGVLQPMPREEGLKDCRNGAVLLIGRERHAKVEPSHSRLVTEIGAWWASAIRLAIANPRPVPPTSERDGTLASRKQAGFHVDQISGCGFSFDDGALWQHPSRQPAFQ